MSDPIDLLKKPVNKRSSLRTTNNILNPQDILSYNKNKKRNRVSFQMGGAFQKGLKATFEKVEESKVNPVLAEKKKKFEANRRQSVHNEFSLVKELMKQNKIDEAELEDEDDMVKENMMKNVNLGKKALNEDDGKNDENFEDKVKNFEKKEEEFEKKFKDLEEKMKKMETKK